MAGQFVTSGISLAEARKIRRRLQLLSSSLAQALFKGSYPSEAALIAERGNPSEGWNYYNTSIGQTLTYHKGAWYQYTIDGENGTASDYKGEFSVAPLDPAVDDAYLDSVDGIVYIYNGVAWEIMSQAGTDIYVTYNDSDFAATPSNPTGDGTTGGWHTDATEDVNWLSQKVVVGGPVTTEVLTVATMVQEPGVGDTLTQDVSNATMVVASSTATTITGAVTGIWDTDNTFTSDDVGETMDPASNTPTAIESWGTPIPAANLTGAVGPQGPQGEQGEQGDPGESAFDDIDMPVTTGIVFTKSGSNVTWTTGNLKYKGVDYTIAAEATGDTNKFIYWNLDSVPTTFKTTNDIADVTPTAGEPDRWTMCYNDAGTPSQAVPFKVVHGGLIQADTIIAGTITVGTLIAGIIQSSSLTGFGTPVPTTWTKQVSSSYSDTTANVSSSDTYEDWVVSTAAARENVDQTVKWSINNMKRHDGSDFTFWVKPSLWKRAGSAGGARTKVFTGDEIYISNSVDMMSNSWPEETLADHGIGASDFFEIGFEIKISTVTTTNIDGQIFAQSQDWSSQSIAK